MKKYYIKSIYLKNSNDDYSLRNNILGHLYPDCELFETVKDSIELRSLGVVSRDCIIFFLCEFLKYHAIRYSNVLFLHKTIFLLEKYLNDGKELTEEEIEEINYISFQIPMSDMEDYLFKSICESCSEVLFYLKYIIYKVTSDYCIGETFSRSFLEHHVDAEIIRQDEFIINFMRTGKHLFYL